MSTQLVQNTSGSIVFFLETEAGDPATGLSFSDLIVSYRKSGGSFTSKTLATSAVSSVGTGANGTVSLSVDAPGAAGNVWTVSVVVPVGTSPLSVAVVSTDITVSLSVAGGVPVTLENTATLVAAAINGATALVTATASGTGGDSLSLAETDTFTSGVDYLEDLGAGFYELDFTSTELDTSGPFHVRVTGSIVRAIVLTGYVLTSVPTVEAPEGPTPPTATVFGYVYNIDGTPLAGATITARTLNTPATYTDGSSGAVLSSRLVTAKTDSTGYFTLDLLIGSTVQVNVPSASYRRTFVVPSTSTSLFHI